MNNPISLSVGRQSLHFIIIFMDLLPTFFKPVDIFSSEQEVAWIISFLFGRSDTDRHWTFLTVHAPGDPVDFLQSLVAKISLVVCSYCFNLGVYRITLDLFTNLQVMSLTSAALSSVCLVKAQNVLTHILQHRSVIPTLASLYTLASGHWRVGSLNASDSPQSISQSLLSSSSYM